MEKKMAHYQDIQSFCVSAHEEVDTTYIYDFIQHLMQQKKIVHSKYYITYEYIHHIKEYQITYFDKIFQTSCLQYLKTYDNKNMVYVAEDYFVVYCNHRCIFHQKNSNTLSEEEIKLFVKKRLGLDDFHIKCIHKYEQYLNKNIIQNRVKKPNVNYLLCILILYVGCLCVFLFIYFKGAMQINEEQEAFVNQSIKYKKLLHQITDYKSLFKTLENLTLKSKEYGFEWQDLTFENKQLKLQLHAQKKQSLYQLLSDKAFDFKHSVIEYDTSRETYVLQAQIVQN